MILCFELSMPNVGSWNGKWTGKENYYAITKNMGTKKEKIAKAKEILEKEYYHYDFGDGWSAGVTVTKCTSAEAAKVRRKSDGFSGYEWMVCSIIENNKIQVD